MRALACVLVVITGCKGGGAGDDFPVISQGDDSEITPQPDAPAPLDAPANDGGNTFAGRVCVVLDLRNLTSCRDTGVAGITVQLGTSTGVTLDDGTFTIPRPAGSNLTWAVTGADYVPSIMPLGTVHLIPAVSADLYDDLLDSNGVVLQELQGSVVGRVIQQAAALPGATVAATPPAQYPPLYDGGDSRIWAQNATGARGVFWLVGVPVGTSMVTVTSPSTATAALALPIVDGAITFTTVEFP
ncbi:MAG: hypothetical protein JWP01_1070 [Myxococcales bacterium]|nr:hypothetical protein [Myxococcales bacterium]